MMPECTEAIVCIYMCVCVCDQLQKQRNFVCRKELLGCLIRPGFRFSRTPNTSYQQTKPPTHTQISCTRARAHTQHTQSRPAAPSLDALEAIGAGEAAAVPAALQVLGRVPRRQRVPCGEPGIGWCMGGGDYGAACVCVCGGGGGCEGEGAVPAGAARGAAANGGVGGGAGRMTVCPGMYLTVMCVRRRQHTTCAHVNVHNRDTCTHQHQSKTHQSV